MSNTENNDARDPQIEANILLNNKAFTYISQAGKWASFLGITGFVFCGIFVLMVLALPGQYFMRSGSAAMDTPAFVIVIMKVVYLLLCTVHFFLSLYLYQFGSGAKKNIEFLNIEGIADALGKMKSFF